MVGLDDLDADRKPVRDLIQEADHGALMARVAEFQDAGARAIVGRPQMFLTEDSSA